MPWRASLRRGVGFWRRGFGLIKASALSERNTCASLEAIVPLRNQWTPVAKAMFDVSRTTKGCWAGVGLHADDQRDKQLILGDISQR